MTDLCHDKRVMFYSVLWISLGTFRAYVDSHCRFYVLLPSWYRLFSLCEANWWGYIV